MLGAAEGVKEDKESWFSFLRRLKERGLAGTQLFAADKCAGLIEALGEVFPQARYQRCIVRFYRNVFSVAPRKMVEDATAMLKAIHDQEHKAAAIKKTEDVLKKLRDMKLYEAATKVGDGVSFDLLPENSSK